MIQSICRHLEYFFCTGSGVGLLEFGSFCLLGNTKLHHASGIRVDAPLITGDGIEGPYMVVLTICFCNSMRYYIALCYILQTHASIIRIDGSPINSSINIQSWVSRNKPTD